MTLTIQVKPHTVFVLVGPSVSGKTTLAISLKDQLERQLFKTPQLTDTVRHIEYEEILKDVASPHPVNHAKSLEYRHVVERAAVDMMVGNMVHPVSREFIIMDGNNWSHDTCRDIWNQARRYGYKVRYIVVNHGKTLGLTGSDENVRSYLSLAQFKKSVVRNISDQLYHSRLDIQSLSQLETLKVEVPHANLYKNCHLNLMETDVIGVIGDTHEHVNALTKMREKLKAEFPGIRIALVGDWIDKGKNTLAMLDAIERFADEGDIILHGNHESYVVKRLKGEIEGNPELEARYMTSLSVLLSDNAAAARVIEIYENSLPFLKVTGDQCTSMFVTHAPCAEKYLGKIGEKALVKQRNLSGDKSKDYRESYPHIFEEAKYYKPYHVFGHVAHRSQDLMFKNKVFLDTGAVYGNELSAFILSGKNHSHIRTLRTDALVEKELESTLTKPMNSTS